MARAFSNVIGVDFGQHTLKAVQLLKKGNRVVLSGYSTREVGDQATETDQVSHHLKLLLAEMKTAKAYGVVVSSNQSVLRVIEQPPTPVEVLRNALTLNSAMVLHDTLNDYVFDCDGVDRTGVEGQPASKQAKYVVAGLPREIVVRMDEAFAKNRCSLEWMGLPGLSLFNAFEFSRPDVASDHLFMLLDIGHEKSVVVGGIRGRLAMFRSIEYGGSMLISDLSLGGSAVDAEGVRMLLQQGDPGLAEGVRTSVAAISREIKTSIGFFEGQWDQSVSKIYISGGATQAELLNQILSDELNLPCEVWDPLDRCEINVSRDLRAGLSGLARSLNVAFGAALELTRPTP